MKKQIVSLLALGIAISGCTPTTDDISIQTEASVVEEDSVSEEDVEYDPYSEFESLDDDKLLEYVKNEVYLDTVNSLDSKEYVVENVETSYLSKEYLEELSAYSQSNIYFGYTLDELNEVFQGKRYVFTLGDTGQTVVRELEKVEDTTMAQIYTNVTIGTGVILVCVTISAVAPVVGAPTAFTTIIAAFADTAATFAVSSAAIGSLVSGLTTTYQTGDFDEALKSASLGASEGYMWGAISGAIVGGATEAYALNKLTEGGLSMSEVATIQQESNLPRDIIKQFHSFSEYNVYKRAGLETAMVNNKLALVQPNIDLTFKSTFPDGTEVTNLQRMLKGYAPLDASTGKAYQLHHIGQKADATLAVLTEPQHLGNASILNIFGKSSEIDRDAFNITRKEFWKSLGEIFATGGI